MRRRDLVLGGLVACWLPGRARAVDASSPPGGEPPARVDYRILLGDTEVGHHTVSLERLAEGGLRIGHRRRITVRFLSLPVYTFELTSTEVWRGPSLQELDARGVDDGRPFALHGHATRRGFRATGRSGPLLAPSEVATTEGYWDAAVLSRAYLLDAVKGEVVEPSVRPLDPDGWHVEHGNTRADLRFEGALMILADVDKDGHRVRFERVAS